MIDRPKWVPVKPPAVPLPSGDCPLCGKPIKDIAQAITDKSSGSPAHFDCIIARIAQGETLDRGDAVAYIGGGRFGVIHYDSPQDNTAQGRRDFKITKILEWENKENRAEWRKTVADHFSVT
jgi:hypothetical protein